MKDLFEAYPIVLHQDLLWGDMDAFGHINNTVYLRYFEDVRIAYFDDINVFTLMAKTQMGPIMANAYTDFRLPLAHPDKIHIAGRCEIIGPKKLTMHYKIYSEQHQAIAAEGHGLIVYYDYANNRSCEIPEPIANAIRGIESH